MRNNMRAWRNAAGVVSDAARKVLVADRTSFELVRATGVPAGSDGSASAIYAGTGANRIYCLSTLFGSYVETIRISPSPHEIVSDLERASGECAVVFTEGVAAPPRPSGAAESFEIPAWVKQRLAISADWPACIDKLRRETRQEIGRILRKYGYGCRLSRNDADYADFYERLYEPYATSRFDSAALIVDRQRFLAECRRGIVVQLTHGTDVVGASLLRRIGRTMAIVWSGLATGARFGKLRGRSDALDYFSLLYGHLQGCRWLDFGPSRPDLCDGALRYKARWGAGIHRGRVPQATIRVTCRRDDVGEAFLRRHAFLNRTGEGFAATMYVDGDTGADDLRERISRLITPGVDEYRIVPLSPLDDRQTAAVRGLDANVRLAMALA